MGIKPPYELPQLKLNIPTDLEARIALLTGGEAVYLEDAIDQWEGEHEIIKELYVLI